MTESNSLLANAKLPLFDQLDPADVVPAIRRITAAARNRIDEIVTAAPSFETVVVPLEEIDHEIARVWSPVSHLQMVQSDPEWRAAHQEALPLLTDFSTEIGQRVDLYEAVAAAAASPSVTADPIRQRVCEHRLREFRHAGVSLEPVKKQRFREVMTAMASATNEFSQNVQDATDAWQWATEDAADLAGLPDAVVAGAKQRAEKDGGTGFLLTLDMPTYMAVMNLAESADLRRRFYEAWATRASDRGPLAGEYDNRPIIDNVLALRHEAAQLVGFEHFADYALDGRMARSSDEVLAFLNNLADRSISSGQKELADLVEFAGRDLEAWDVSYFAERLKEQRFSISEEKLKAYFPTDQVVDGLFEIAEELYQISLRPRQDVAVWHESVDFYDVVDTDGQLVGSFYADLYAREGKRAGAWIDECVRRKHVAGEIALPVGYLVCNFTAGRRHHRAEISHSEVVTLFHEFGHMLHHLLTRIDYPTISGINGVPWDAVELPSQFMENFAWEFNVITRLSSHRDDGRALERELFDSLTASRQFNAALAMLRQLEFALFDFRLHAEYNPSNAANILDTTLASVRNQVCLVKPPSWNRYANSFSHIFAGGYAAGYYSYKWAEVLAADAYTALDNVNGKIDVETAKRFRRSILEIGGSRDIHDAFIDFRGRPPSLEPLLELAGIAA